MWEVWGGSGLRWECVRLEVGGSVLGGRWVGVGGVGGGWEWVGVWDGRRLRWECVGCRWECVRWVWDIVLNVYMSSVNE